MYQICYWRVSGRYFQPEPAMYSTCFYWFPGPLTPSEIQAWPVPQCAKDVRQFLGLVQYLAAFLLRLAEHCSVLTPLMTKEAQKDWPGWMNQHQVAFQNIKDIVLSTECLMMIDHEDMGGWRIFITCDVSDQRTGACLSFGETWEAAWLVAWDSMQLSQAERNYPMHEKEMLAIVQVLKKFHADLLGIHFTIHTDHQMLECFQGQRDLSQQQAWWQEFLAEYNFEIVYVKGEENTVADALSHMPDEGEGFGAVAVTLTVSADPKMSEAIRVGYRSDSFCRRILDNLGSFPWIKLVDGLIYISTRLMVPWVGTLWEDLFQAAYDSLGHFGVEKSYANLCSAYYWPKMRTELEQAYVPGCNAFQWNKGPTQ